MLPLRVPCHVGRPSKLVFPVEDRAIGRVGVSRARDRLRPAAEHHHHAPGGVELDDHVRPLIDHPDVVLSIDADLVGELDPVETDAPLFDEVAVRIELEEPRIAAAVIHKDVPFRVGRDADALAQIQIRRELEEIRHGGVRNDRNVLRCRFRLGDKRRSAEQRDRGCGQK